MQIQVHAGCGVELCEGLSAQIRAEVQRALGRFDADISEVCVHLDEDAATACRNEKRCVLEAHLQGCQPIAIIRHADTAEAAVAGAAEKLNRLFAHKLERVPRGASAQRIVSL
jgi:hypothetical protein